jgi:hypothetical protein
MPVHTPDPYTRKYFLLHTGIYNFLYMLLCEIFLIHTRFVVQFILSLQENDNPLRCSSRL